MPWQSLNLTWLCCLQSKVLSYFTSQHIQPSMGSHSKLAGKRHTILLMITAYRFTAHLCLNSDQSLSKSFSRFNTKSMTVEVKRKKEEMKKTKKKKKKKEAFLELELKRNLNNPTIRQTRETGFLMRAKALLF